MYFSFESHKRREFKSECLPAEALTGRTASDRQERIPGWSQEDVAAAVTVQVGVGGTGSQLALYQARIGVGASHLVDHDYVELSNLNRILARAEDLHEPKAYAVARRAVEQGVLGTTIHAYPLYFGEFRKLHAAVLPNVIIECVDNNETRLQVAKWALEVGRPCIHMGVSADAGAGYVLVHVPGQACLGCYLGKALFSQTMTPCSGTPAALDILQVVGGHAAYALSSLLTERPRYWNMTRVFLATGVTMSATVGRDPNCQVCGRVC
jgi:adenylyltransferase/sulfurtransferase